MNKETCVQCGKQQAQPFGVIAIMAFDPETAMQSVGSDRDRNWMAMPVCPDCHQHPRLKAHFFYRQQMEQALGRAGSSNLG